MGDGYAFYDALYGQRFKEKVGKLTLHQKRFFWKHPEDCDKICNICHKKINKMSELDLDRTKIYPNSKKKLVFAHHQCNA